MDISAAKQLEDSFNKLKASTGLVDVKFYPGEVSDVSLEDFCQEANSWLTIMNDSQDELMAPLTLG